MKHSHHDESLLLVVLLSQPLGDDFDHDVGLQPVICPDCLLLHLFLLLHLNKDTSQWQLLELVQMQTH